MGQLYHINEANRPQPKDQTQVRARRNHPSFGTYRLDKHLRDTSRFQLWQAHIEEDQERLILKTAQLGHLPNCLDRQLTTVRQAITLQHPNICRTLDVGVQDHTLFIACEAVLGRDCSELLGGRPHLEPRGRGWNALRHHAPWPWRALALPFALSITHDVCQAVHTLHGELGRAHGELCPWHVMVSFDGEVKLLNAGLAPITNELKADSIAESWALFRYRAPERVVGPSQDIRTDIYSLGLLLFELSTGTPWVGGDADAGLLTRVRNARTPQAEELPAYLPPAVNSLIARALQHAPDARFQDASTMSRALKDLLGSLDIRPSQERLARLMWRTFQHGPEDQ